MVTSSVFPAAVTHEDGGDDEGLVGHGVQGAGPLSLLLHPAGKKGDTGEGITEDTGEGITGDTGEGIKLWLPQMYRLFYQQPSSKASIDNYAKSTVM